MKTIISSILCTITIFGLYACVTSGNGNGTGSSTSRIAYKHPTIVLIKGVAMTPDTLVSSITGGFFGYTVSPLFPAGITMDSATGTLSGTPLVNAAAANYTVYALTSSGVDSTKVNITVQNSAGNNSLAPIVTTTSAQTDSRNPTWTWQSGGWGNGTYRYRLDNADLTTGSTITTSLKFAPAAPLADGAHVLYVQEKNAAGNWSPSGSATTTITAHADSLAYYNYNDHIDNDFDRQTVASPTPMRWHDYDGDHGVRYDYDDSARFTTYVKYSIGYGLNFGNPGDIGHPIHRYLRPELYVTYASLMAAYPGLADTSNGSRIYLMKNRCRTLVDTFVIDLQMPATLATSIRKMCDTLSPVLKSTVMPPVHSDWIGGTVGVDEEVADKYDNDYDGLIDEDTRNLTGFDDDRDAPIALCMLYGNCTNGATANPMQWKDANGNHCIDIDSTHHTTADSARIFCMGTLENRLYLARKGGADSLNSYYERFNETSSNCIKTYNTSLDPVFKAKFNATQGEILNACGNNHIWIAPRPPRSEWTGGLFGIDEEICGDGIDNDGDGLIDEDCGSH